MTNGLMAEIWFVVERQISPFAFPGVLIPSPESWVTVAVNLTAVGSFEAPLL